MLVPVPPSDGSAAIGDRLAAAAVDHRTDRSATVHYIAGYNKPSGRVAVINCTADDCAGMDIYKPATIDDRAACPPPGGNVQIAQAIDPCADGGAPGEDLLEAAVDDCGDCSPAPRDELGTAAV